MRTVAPLLALSALLLGPGGAAGQGWTLDVYGGRVAYDLATSTSGENGAVLGVRYRDSATGWLYLSTGVPFGSDDSMWGSAGLGTRQVYDAGRVELGVDLGSQGYLYREPTLSTVGAGGLLGARPLVALAARRVRLEARSGWVQYGNRFSGTSFSRGVHDSDLKLRFALGRVARITGSFRHVRAEEDDYSHVGGRLTVGSGRFRGWTSVGAWTSDALPTTEWGAGASVRLDDAGRAELGISVRQDASDPVYWNAPRRRWSLGMSYSLGGASRATMSRNRAMAAVTPEVAEGMVRIRIPAGSSGGAPSVAGDFTDWEPVPMVREGKHWTATFELEPGVYRYAFRSPSGEWYVPESVPSRRSDGMGGHVALLVVQRAER